MTASERLAGSARRGVGRFPLPAGMAAALTMRSTELPDSGAPHMHGYMSALHSLDFVPAHGRSLPA